MLLYMTPLSPAARHKLLLHNRNRNTAVSTGGRTAKWLTLTQEYVANAMGVRGPNHDPEFTQVTY